MVVVKWFGRPSMRATLVHCVSLEVRKLISAICSTSLAEFVDMGCRLQEMGSAEKHEALSSGRNALRATAASNYLHGGQPVHTNRHMLQQLKLVATHESRVFGENQLTHV